MATLLARLSWSVETDGTPLGFGEMEVWGDLIPRVLRTLGCMTQARWACDLFHVIFDISDETFRQPDM